MKSKGAFKTIGEVCEIVGLIDPETGKKKTHVLRFWEKHFKEIKPSLIYKGRRYYSEKNIDYVKKIKKLLKVKYTNFDDALFISYRDYLHKKLV